MVYSKHQIRVEGHKLTFHWVHPPRSQVRFEYMQSTVFLENAHTLQRARDLVRRHVLAKTMSDFDTTHTDHPFADLPIRQPEVTMSTVRLLNASPVMLAFLGMAPEPAEDELTASLRLEREVLQMLGRQADAAASGRGDCDCPSCKFINRKAREAAAKEPVPWKVGYGV